MLSDCLIVSDRCALNQTEDKSGQLLRSLVSKYLEPVSVISALVPDESEKIEVRKIHQKKINNKNFEYKCKSTY